MNQSPRGKRGGGGRGAQPGPPADKHNNRRSGNKSRNRDSSTPAKKAAAMMITKEDADAPGMAKKHPPTHFMIMFHLWMITDHDHVNDHAILIPN